MAAMRANPRLQVGSAAWIADERGSAQQIVEAEAEEFAFSARNEVDWLNEHMAEIFSRNPVNVSEIFKTPGKLRGKTPQTIRKGNALEARAPLSDLFSASPLGSTSLFKQAPFPKPVTLFQVAEDEPAIPEPPTTASIPHSENSLHQNDSINQTNHIDSGYHGSQSEATQPTQPNEPITYPALNVPTSIVTLSGPKSKLEANDKEMEAQQAEEERRSTENSFQSAREEQTRQVTENTQPQPEYVACDLHQSALAVHEPPLLARVQLSPPKLSPKTTAASKEDATEPAEPVIESEPPVDCAPVEDLQSPASDNSSPIRPIVRKSSLNFASLPAREPITTKKSIGNRPSRTSQLDQSGTSYHGVRTGGKSLGNVKADGINYENEDEMDIDELDAPEPARDEASRLHNKTSTQRLQDQISMLGKSQNARPPSKSITGNGLAVCQPTQATQAPAPEESRQQMSPLRKERPPPGAFPEDEDDSWIGPPNAVTEVECSTFSPRPQLSKSYSTDVMEDIHDKESIGGSQFSIAKRGEELIQRSPLREPSIPNRTTGTLVQYKSVSTSVLRSPRKAGDSIENKTISVSNPNPSTAPEESTTPPKSPSRSIRGSPLKAAKDKFSSILKTSRGLFASSAAVSADAKSSALSPHPSRIGMQQASSKENVFQYQTFRPDLVQSNSQLSLRMPGSPSKSPRKTRASTEREERRKQEEAKEAKEAQKMNDQLEKARKKVKDDARVYHMEQERVAAMQKEVAVRQEQEILTKVSRLELPRATRSSPRKTKAQTDAEPTDAIAPSTEDASKDVEMTDTSHSMRPPAVPRPKSQIGRATAKRPLKLAKEPASKAKPPTVIRVDTGSQRGHQHHPSTTTLAASLQESLTGSQPSSTQGTLRHKASNSSIQSKTSTSSFKSAATKTLEAAARKKEQDELAAKRKREAREEVERQRAAIKEEERRKEEQLRRQEAERQRELQRERERATAAADAKKAAQRQAIEKRRLEMEKAKETRPPPPPVRPQPVCDSTPAMPNEKALPPIPQSKAPRINTGTSRTQEDIARPLNSMQNSTKAPPKRPLQQDTDDRPSRPPIPRNGPSYQHNEGHTKRRKTSEAFDDSDNDLTENHPKMTAPPIRQSSSRPKDMATKSLFPSGYTNALPTTANFQKSTLLSQHHMNQLKPANPMDMTQVSKAPIAFASSSSQGNTQQYKTPARPGTQHGGKSTAKSAKSSPRYVNGENIVLPEIQTDSEDEDEDNDNGFQPPGWTESPAIRNQLVKQEGIDAASIFGQPKALDLEEVFSKSKDRFHKFRARTSSANWSGEDRLTADEIRKDIEGRDKLRRQGFWTYDSMV